MKLITLTVLALLSATAFAEDWQPVPSADGVFIDRESVQRKGQFAFAKMRAVKPPVKSAAVAYDCYNLQAYNGLTSTFEDVTVGTNAEAMLRTLCARSAKF